MEHAAKLLILRPAFMADARLRYVKLDFPGKFTSQSISRSINQVEVQYVKPEFPGKLTNQSIDRSIKLRDLKPKFPGKFTTYFYLELEIHSRYCISFTSILIHINMSGISSSRYLWWRIVQL